ncbi:MAG TPA: IS1380 family transposase [Rugosimonospora sp.]|nr:IS1380 family transposase [Rugosimonospora sp.]
MPRKIKRAIERKRRRRLAKRTSAWSQGLELTGGACGLIGAVGAPLLRLLAEESGLRAALSGALTRSGFVPGHDRGQVLIDVAVALGLGATSVAGAVEVLRQSLAVLQTVASAPTAWRALEELDTDALARVAKARAAQRRLVWARLAARPDGFPWVAVAGQVWHGWIVIDVDASLVESHSDKQGAAPTYKKHIFGLHPILVSCANTGEMLAVLLRNGNAGSNTVTDHISVLSEAVAQLPARHRRRIIFRADGAGATKDLLAWIKTEAAQHGYTWHYSVGFDVTEPVRQAIIEVPAQVWVPALTPQDKLRRGAHVTEISGLLSLADGWPCDLRVLARTEPLHPRHRKQASEAEKQRGQRFQATATDLPGHHYPRLDAFHRNHASVEAVIKDGKDLGLRRLPSYSFAFNQAWCAIVAIAADLLAWLRHLALDHHPGLSKATPATLRRALLGVPARLVRRARKRLIRLCDDHPYQADLILAWNKIRALATPP